MHAVGFRQPAHQAPAVLSPEVSHPGATLRSNTGSAMQWEESCGKQFSSTFICVSAVLHCTQLQYCWVPNYSQFQFLLFSSLRRCLSSFLLSLSGFPFDMPSTATLLCHRRPSQKEWGLIIWHLDLPLLPPALKKIGG